LILRSPRISIIVAMALTSMLAAGTAAQSPHYEVELITGTCAEPGGRVASLAEPIAGGDLTGSPVEMESVATALGPAVDRAHSALPMTLADIATGGHAVRVFERGRPPGRLVACGEFGDVEVGVADLQLGLAGTADSSLYGVVWLRDNGDGTTDASVAIAAQAVPVAPAASDAEIEVAIRKSLYVPSPLEVKAGTTVTWVNEDVLPHTTTATDGAFDSGYMALDARFSYTFDTPGEYPIFCVYHPRMRSVVIVS
jgi:plastocyanin